MKAYQKRYYAKASSNKVARNAVLRQSVDTSLDKGWSPGEIAGSSDCPVSKRTIYRYVTLYALQHKLYFKGKPKRRKAMYRLYLLEIL